MPTVSLLTPSTIADASHQVTAPGGYEWWYFDAEDAAGDLRMVAIFFQGFVFHPGYLRAYGRYAKAPTRNRPPLPSEYPCVYFVLYRGSEIVAQFMSQFRPEAYSAATDRVSVSIGPNSLESSADGALRLKLKGVPWVLTGRGPKVLESQRLIGSFQFTPVFGHEPMQRRFFSRSWSKADHHWVIANPLCSVTGEVELYDLDTQRGTKFTMNCRGYHDHNYGTGPIGPGLKRWMWGRVLMADHAAMFHLAQPKNAVFEDDLHLLEADAMGLRETAVDRFNADWSRKTSTLLRYPAWVEAGPLQLSNPSVIDASPFYLRLAYDASVRGVAGQAFCEIAYPHRLRWPILGRMIEMSIRRQ
jgi:carotenoid 1,2-hydratase